PGLKALSSAAVFESLATMLVPEIEKLRIDGNEQTAVDLLRRIHAAERDFAAAALVDRDGDRTGEYGFLDELMGVAPARGGTRIGAPPLKGALEDAGNGCGAASGYYFEVLLPGAKGVPVAATARESVDASLAERAFRVYAWPRENGKLGKHAFVVD